MTGETTQMGDRGNRTWRIARAIDGDPTAEDFKLTDEAVPAPAEGQVLIRTIYISIAPGVRPLMPYAGAEPDVTQRKRDDDNPNPVRIRIGEKMRSGIVPSMSPFAGGTVGQVIESRHPGYKPGDYIFGGRYWRDYEIVEGDASLRIDPSEAPIEADLSLLGRSSFTAWVGWNRFCAAKAGETIVVSAAAGNIGMVIVQLAKLAGLKVIGIASGTEKCRFVTEELGADACIDRKAEDIGEAVDREAPEGVDIYFDNVGGYTRAAVYDKMATFGRVIVCGMAAEYGGGEQSPLQTGAILAKRLRIQGFVVLDHDEDYQRFRDDFLRLSREGKLKWRQQIFEGLEKAPDALNACITGRGDGGKILVRVSEDTSRNA